VSGKEKSMETTDTVENRRGELRAKLEARMERARLACNGLKEKTISAARTSDKTIRQHPYQSIGIALGVGILLGALAMRSRRAARS
jgi:ElaB/YqjD/DUF883 family membrane-anchored ribosome-binding protein